MNFGLLYELQMPKPWSENRESETFFEAIDQIVLAESRGFSHCWCVEHHMLPEWSHSSAPEVFLAA